MNIMQIFLMMWGNIINQKIMIKFQKLTELYI